MNILNHQGQARETWREGVLTEMRGSFLVGGRQRCIFEQFCDPGLGAPVHIHAVEEVLECIAGRMEVTLEGATAVMEANQSQLLPPGARHGFRNVGTATLHVRATLAAPIFEGQYDSTKEQSRRWSPS